MKWRKVRSESSYDGFALVGVRVGYMVMMINPGICRLWENVDGCGG